MIFLGDSLIPYEATCFIRSIEEIKNTQPNSTLIFNYDEQSMQYCFKNNLRFAIVAKNIKEGLYANALQAKYIICPNHLAKSMQTIAQNYLFDAKVLVIIQSNEELENIAKDEIDGVIYENLLA